jgi:glycosyltransferase involved in cell wall biosynthesis
MKIALATANLGIHGVATFTLNLSQWLQTAGHAVTVLTLAQGEWWPRLTELGIQGECIAQQPWESSVSHAKRLAAWLTAQGLDLLVVNIGSINSRPLQLCLHLLPDGLPVAILLRSDEPVVYTIAGLNRTAWNCAVGVSPKVQQTAAMRFRDKPVYCILNGVELPTATQLRERVGWESPLRLLFVGRLTDEQKGIFRLPPILAACRQQNLPVQLTVIGDGPDRERLNQLFSAAGCAELVKTLGTQTNTTVLAQMRAHHLLLLPSNFEGLGTVILEAQANGCVPIAAHLVGATDSTVIDKCNGRLVQPTDIAGFVDSIRTFLTPDLWHDYSQAGIRYAQQHYAIQTMAENYLALFEELSQGVYPLPQARSSLRRQGHAPFGWRDYLSKRGLMYCRPLHILYTLKRTLARRR